MRNEIVERLRMRDPAIVVRSFDRPNISLAVQLFDDERRKADRMVDLVTDTAGPGIVYVATRREANELAERLRDRGVKAEAYHAGMKTAEESRLVMMRGYAETRACRREFLLNYFGEQYDAPCGNCDNCRAGLVTEHDEDEPFPLDSRVVHDTFGEGLVMRYEGGKVTVLFDDAGYRTLQLDAVQDNNLLHPAT